jgi:hypothetical protein
MGVIVRIGGRSAIGDVNVAMTRWRCLERALPPWRFVQVTFLTVLPAALPVTLRRVVMIRTRCTILRLPAGGGGWGMREEERASQDARLQAEYRPLANPARRVEMRIPRIVVVAASRRPGAKRIPGRGVVHDAASHRIERAMFLPLPGRRRVVARCASPSSCSSSSSWLWCSWPRWSRSRFRVRLHPPRRALRHARSTERVGVGARGRGGIAARRGARRRGFRRAMIRQRANHVRIVRICGTIPLGWLRSISVAHEKFARAFRRQLPRSRARKRD